MNMKKYLVFFGKLSSLPHHPHAHCDTPPDSFYCFDPHKAIDHHEAIAIEFCQFMAIIYFSNTYQNVFTLLNLVVNVLDVLNPTYMSHIMRKTTFCICENKDADQLTAKLISAFVFATYIV